MARAIWSGSISFGLVSVPVKAYSATKDHKVHFHELDRSGNRVQHQKVSSTSGRASKPAPKEMKLAEQIIDSLSADWDPKRYRDTFTDQLRDIIERKAKGEKVEVAEEAESTADVIDLMAALEQSVNKAKAKRSGGATKRRTTANKQTASKKKTKAPARKSA